jgi:hypothetical protein
MKKGSTCFHTTEKPCPLQAPVVCDFVNVEQSKEALPNIQNQGQSYVGTAVNGNKLVVRGIPNNLTVGNSTDSQVRVGTSKISIRNVTGKAKTALKQSSTTNTPGKNVTGDNEPANSAKSQRLATNATTVQDVSNAVSKTNGPGKSSRTIFSSTIALLLALAVLFTQ